MECPKCKLVNPPAAARCDCGYDFQTGIVQEPYDKGALDAVSGLGMKTLGRFVMHLVIALGTLVLGMMFAVVTQRLLLGIETDNARGWLFDVPYSPFFWGTALITGFVLNLRLRYYSACLTWTAGAGWLALGILVTVRGHNPEWCRGCSVTESVWRNLFTVNTNECLQECLGELFFTAPSLAFIGYSIGAWMSILSTRRRPLTSGRQATSK